MPKSLYYTIMLLSFFLLIIRWKKLDSKVHLLIVILAAALITEKVHDIFAPAPVTKYIYHAYQVIEAALLGMYYYQLFQIKRNRLIVLAGITGYLIYISYAFVYHSQNLGTYKSYDLVIGSFFITLYSILYLVELYKEEQPVDLKRYPHFWIVIANLMFYSTTVFYYSFQFYLLNNSPDYNKLALIPQFFNLILYTFYSIAFICNMQMRRSG